MNEKLKLEKDLAIELIHNESALLFNIIQERDKDIHKIHKKSSDINEIMKDISGLVKVQNDNINNINNNVENSQKNMNKGVRELKVMKNKQDESCCCFFPTIFSCFQ